MSPTIALELQESCCKHMGCPHATCTTCRPSALEGCYVRMRCRRLSAGTTQLQPLHDHVTTCIADCCEVPGIAVGQQVMRARLATATHVSHSSICSGCGACERGREHIASTSAARRWLEPVNMSATIALQLQESCCNHMGCPHATCTTCRPSASPRVLLCAHAVQEAERRHDSAPATARSCHYVYR